MGVEFDYVLAWMLPAFTGSGIWLAFQGRLRGPADIAAALGTGWLIGLVVASTIGRLVAQDDTTHAFGLAWPWLAGVGIAAWAVAFARARGMPRVESRLRWTMPRPALLALGFVLLAAILVRLVSIGEEASLRPVFPWDAWSAWAIKPKTWFLLGHADPYVSMAQWLSNPHAPTRTAAAGIYPELLAWVELWFASAAHAWIEPLVNLAWCGALATFALAAYGCWRAIGIAATPALALVYALASLPLIDAHVALAGYADLWIAVALGLAVLAWTRWLILRERGQWWLAIGIALCLPAIKLEGTVWLLAFAAVVALDFVPSRWRFRVAAIGGSLAVLAVLVLGWLPLLGARPLPVPGIGVFELSWHGVGSAVVASLFTLPNWHLLWYVVPILLIVRRRRFGVDPAAKLVGLLLLIDVSFLFLLFFFTPASAWARDYTSANRLILQIVPSVFVLGAVLLRPLSAEDPNRGPGFAPRIAPA